MPPPEKIYLQWHGDADPADYPDGSEPRGDDVTWCRDKIFDHDIAYVRADKLAALEAERDQLRAENAELQNELTKGIHTCGPTCRKTPRCAEMADLREELVDTKAALFSAEMRAQSAEKPNCKTCDHYIPPLSFAGEPACEFANTESVLVCVNGDAYIGTDPVRLYETGGG